MCGVVVLVCFGGLRSDMEVALAAQAKQLRSERQQALQRVTELAEEQMEAMKREADNDQGRVGRSDSPVCTASWWSSWLTVELGVRRFQAVAELEQRLQEALANQQMGSEERLTRLGFGYQETIAKLKFEYEEKMLQVGRRMMRPQTLVVMGAAGAVSDCPATLRQTQLSHEAALAELKRQTEERVVQVTREANEKAEQT